MKPAPKVTPELAALVDLLVEFAVDDFFVELEALPSQPEQAEVPQ
jgi:hypothetical protein